MRNQNKLRVIALLAALLLVPFLIAACGDDDDDNGDSGSAAEPTASEGAAAEPTEAGDSTEPTEEAMDEMPLEGASFTVGSKEFTEQLILGQIAIIALENAGADVTDSTNITGTDNVRAALDSGEIDMYWEYTGTGWSVILGRDLADAPTEPQALYDEVSAADLEENQVVWLERSPVNNTYAIVTLRSRGEDLGVSTLTEFADLVTNQPDQATLCAATEWLTRPDGYPALEEQYGFDVPEDQINEFATTGPIAAQVADGSDCNFGELFATDGTIAANDLVIVEDDQNHFPVYNLAVTINQDAYEPYADALDAIFAPISTALTNEVMQELNARVDAEGELEADVARDWLESEGFISS